MHRFALPRLARPTPLLVAVAALCASVACNKKADSGAPAPEAAAEAAPAPVEEAPRPAARTAADWNYPAIAWRPEAYGLSKMGAERKPGLVVVMATWCPHCREYSGLFSDPEVVALAKRFEMILIEDDTEGSAGSRWKVDGNYFPRTFFVAPDGTIDQGFKTSNPRYAYFFNASARDELVASLRRAADKYGVM